MKIGSIEYPKGSHNLYNIEEKEFKELKPAELFIDKDGDLFIKIEPIPLIDFPDLNAVDLETGEATQIGPGEQIRFLDPYFSDAGEE